MNSKIILLSVAVVAVGLFALPSTMSLFSGQHTWYDGANVSCQKCHQDIYDEVTTASAYHWNFTAKYGDACARCHTTGPINTNSTNITYGQWQKRNGSGVVTAAVNLTAHAAVTVECLACHGTSATAFANKIQGAAEAHRDFYYASVSNQEVGDINQSSLATAGINTGPAWYTVGTYNQSVIKLKGTNTACIGCHTHAVVNVTWKRSVGYG
jgi:nitrate/TMAO reductase-like tetraheme cytochrome c subunit